MPSTVQEMLRSALEDRDRAIGEARRAAEERLTARLRTIMRSRELSISALAEEAREAGLRGLGTRFSIHKLLREYPESREENES